MTVGVVGLGYVGLPLAVAFAEAGDAVVALDVDPLKVSAVAAGDSYIEDIPSERLQAVLAKIRATYRYADLAQADAVLICVPTPLTDNREPDLGPLTPRPSPSAQVLQPGQLIVLESTTYPGTTRERLVPAARVNPTCASAPTSTSPSRPSASTRAAPTTRCATRPRWSAGSRRRAWIAPTSSTAASATTSSGSRPPRPPR